MWRHISARGGSAGTTPINPLKGESCETQATTEADTQAAAGTGGSDGIAFIQQADRRRQTRHRSTQPIPPYAKEEFRAAYDEAKRMVLEEAINQFRLFAGEAAQTLRDLMREPINPPSARATAARGLLEVLLRAVETQDLAERHERIAKLMQEHAG